MKTFVDQMNHKIRLESVPRRIVSLVPSQTQLLHYLGLEDEVVGITKFCIEPNIWFREKARVGGTKNVNLEKIKALSPDLIIGNKEENDRDNIEKMRSIAPIWMSDIVDLSDALGMMRKIGHLVDRSDKAEQLVSEVSKRFSELRTFVESSEIRGKSVLYFIWSSPNMIAGKNTFVDDMLSACGLVNLTNLERYPKAVQGEQPDFVFLSSEPFPFSEKHIDDFHKVYPKSKIVLVDGEMFSWYGSKLKEAPAYFKSLLVSMLSI
ncbi:MAG: helical backbone metal receptor [Crocinitomicaceae bacterium]|nr:helical backbone metal receptor [Crocinitomicaceae bacterium]